MKSALNLPNFRYVSFEIDLSQKLMDTVFPWRSILQGAGWGGVAKKAPNDRWMGFFSSDSETQSKCRI